VSNLGTGVNVLKSDFLKSSSIDLGDNRFPQETDSLLRANTTSSDHNEVILDNTIMRESTHRSDILLSQIRESRGIVLNTTGSRLSYSVNLLVQFSSVMETEITSSGDSPPYSSWMPRSNTTNSSVTSMSLLR
jgi:hypothetical protein